MIVKAPPLLSVSIPKDELPPVSPSVVVNVFVPAFQVSVEVFPFPVEVKARPHPYSKATDVLGNVDGGDFDVLDDNGIRYAPNEADFSSAPDFNSFGETAHYEFTTTFMIDDLSLYEDFFLEHREYTDATNVQLLVNGNVLFDLTTPGLTTAVSFEEDPLPIATFTPIDRTFLRTGSNDVRIIIGNKYAKY